MKLKNRGAISNPEGRFEQTTHEEYDDGWELEEEQPNLLETTFSAENAKSIISRNNSPDLSFEQSINPYRGCEHGCIYCYARPTHSYLNLSAGLDFETKIFYKVNAAELLEKEFKKPRYVCKNIVLGANTDPYQPIESKLKITRGLLEVFNKYNHPVSIITKNSLIERDIDILSEMTKKNLVNVAISITSLSRSLKRILEPRTSEPKARIRTVKLLTEQNIPVRVMVAPVIPLINDMDIEKILQEVSEAGACYASYVLIRLPHEVKDLFKEWLLKHVPDRAEHVMSIIRQMRDGKEYDATYGKRMRGEGEFANLLAARFKLACKRFNLNIKPYIQLDTEQFNKMRQPQSYEQLSLWDILES